MRSTTSALALVLLSACGGASAAPTTTTPTSDRPLRGRLPGTCVAPRPEGIVGGVLAPELLSTLYDETARVAADAVCGCARSTGVYAPGRVGLSVVIVPGQGRIASARARSEGGARDSDDWPAFQRCLDETLTRASIPVHTIGSDVIRGPADGSARSGGPERERAQPADGRAQGSEPMDADPTDARIQMPIHVELRE